MIYRVKLKYVEEFRFTIKADSKKGAEAIALQLMSDTDPTASDYFWDDSEIIELNESSLTEIETDN